MAIVRVRGGNSGIAEYLREGQKQGRAFNRDELDMRVCLDGNLSLTENIIDSIPDKNQDRYLHITISFRENEVPIETLEAVTQEYKNMFLSAYNDDEVNFYAEAHLPKIKTITDRNTGEEKERKPHIHIVIPKTNLLTGRSLDPVGLYKHHEKYHEAIQEKLNTKFSLENPKDFVRLTDDHQAQILSRVKADTFKGFRVDVKKEAFNILEQGNYRDYSAYKSALSQSFYEVRVRNEGKSNEYLAVKTSQDSNYINLKSPLFEKKYIEERKIERVKPTEKQVDRLLNDWTNRVSKEIKYINKASKKMQVMYRAADVEGKKEIILNRERGFMKLLDSTPIQDKPIKSTVIKTVAVEILPTLPLACQKCDLANWFLTSTDINTVTENGTLTPASPEKAQCWCEKFNRIVWQTGSKDNINITDCDGAHEIPTD
nr:relaxase/mobilization nuclease domain-containing protein [Serratia entomophila]ULG11305.1 relaxase [Serratia entomophila]